MNFSEKEINNILNHGLSIKEVERQINILKNGLPFTGIIDFATLNKGIIGLSNEQMQEFIDIFDNKKDNYKMEKFVPASGAATRMFKEWIFFHDNYNPKKDYYERFVKKHSLKTFEESLDDFIDNLSAYAFYEDLMGILVKENPDYHQLDENKQVWKIIHYILSAEGLGFRNIPKAFIKFHRYRINNARTAMEEHLIEAEKYAKGNTEKALVHFTISPQYESRFKELTEKFVKKYKVNISYSFQKSNTDTVMIDENNEIIKDNYGNIIFRPGGHGALIENIQDLESDIIFIKNIDNIQIENKSSDTLLYKKVLAGYLMKLLEKNKKYLFKLRSEKPVKEELKEIEHFAKKDLNINFIEGYQTLNNSGKREYLFYKLNRPIRIAGMVKNTGEPGGGPFWTLDKNGVKSLQIVEKSQIDLENVEQKEIFTQSTHFNPVDLVISIKDFEGNKFDLREFVNQQSAFISEKSVEGNPVKVYERPGLWNGAMDSWNTVFIEVPLTTFSPVKIVQDLLKYAHQ